MTKLPMALGLALLMGSPVMADMNMDTTGKAGMTHETTLCKKHCNIMDLEKEVKALKTKVSQADKLVTKEHLNKDIQMIEKKLQALKEELEGVK